MVIMRQYDGRRVDSESLLDDFPRIYGSAINGAAEKLVEAQHAVAVIEIQAAKQLVIEVLHAGLQESFGVCGAADRLAGRQ